MKDPKSDNPRKYDHPIPKPPDELFEDFLRNTNARLITRRFNVNPRRTVRSENNKAD